ncbi:multiple C2 and transmembrane domain-containing protein-like isoform X2 [Achroia grisella]|uniref:multiple C2 and transmembrane domain-containing protein-like isoform X2 n=1 Tax=Achroia grisella TaxID=688607 RepID=UPI0027D2D36A|nr:multiple C2 and transmembrane domain-containing protein-like isoform X2 [Achroia grisella]
MRILPWNKKNDEKKFRLEFRQLITGRRRVAKSVNSEPSLRSSLSGDRSFAVSDGLVMDPLAPTALAVSTELMERIGSGLTLLRDHGKKVQKFVFKNRKYDILRKSWNSIVNVVLIEAKDLPDGPTNGSSGLYCKFRLGAESHKSKLVTSKKPTWRERFNLYLYDDNHLDVTVWCKGKQKNFMGRCAIDLSNLEKEKTHDVWHDLECGFGSIHLLITLSGSIRDADSIPTTQIVKHEEFPEEQYIWKLSNWNEVGKMLVTVYGAKGLGLGISGKADAYCVLELDNCRVQTHTDRATSEPNWNKTYSFTVNDITSTLDIGVYNESIISGMKGETLGKLSIPLLRINNDELRWYALKNRSKKSSAKGNCPRILLQISIIWNPVKASLRVLSPKEIKYIQKPPKFNIPLIYSNLKFIKDTFNALYISNEHYKRVFEWESREKSTVALIVWLAFWYFFSFWMTPLLLLAPFLYQWISQRYFSKNNALILLNYSDDDVSDEELESHKDDKTLKTRLYGLQDLTFTIKNSIDYLVSVFERLKNLSNFTVPYLTYLAISVLMLSSVVLYFIPVKYLFMALGIYKFMRKLLNPNRVPNNDLLDFISRVPDDEIVKQWRELKVPEPNLSRSGSTRRKDVQGEN